VTLRVLVVQHEDDDPIHLMGEWMDGVDLTASRPYDGDPVPASIDGYDGLVVMGGAMGAHDDEKAPWLPAVRDLIRVAADARVPTLGICLGMQLMTRRSQEGARAGLGWIDAEVLRFDSLDGSLKVPHMGWNVVRPVRRAALTETLPEQSRFYFVHSFYVRCDDDADVLLTTTYGDEFHSGFHRGNVWGVQFHPEKSHRFGMHLLRSFAERC